ncbi:MAG: TVP38/TMEM64 family protein [Ilumatobacter sp.]|nr:MAG: TVP38/TMEM64 family protein [Ilumatobacter sp.]
MSPAQHDTSRSPRPSSTSSVMPTTAMRRYRIAFVLTMWIAIAGGWFWYRRSSGLSTTAAIQEAVDSASGSWWAIAGFMVLSMLRPFVLVPATLLTMAAGLLFGPVAGVAVAAAGANASALVGHAVGAAFVGEVERDGRIGRWRTRLATNGFESVLLMRLIFLPYDLVNYAAGYLRVRRWPFLAATAIGSLPGTVSFVLLGTSLTSLADGTGAIDRRALLASVILIVASIAASRIVRRRTADVTA